MLRRNSKYFLILLLFALVLPFQACLQTENSSEDDDENFQAPPPGVVISPEFAAVRAIFSTSCGGGCHAYAGYTEDEFIDEALVTPGNRDASPIYTALTGSTSPTGRKDMPIGSPLSQSELDAFTTWIDSIEP